MARASVRRSTAAACMLAPLLGLLEAGPASAHVKWFCGFDVASQPRLLHEVATSDFGAYSVLALFVLMTGCLMEGTPVGRGVAGALNRVTAGLHTQSDVLLRGLLGFFLVALWTTGGILLTPELKTDWPLISWLQLAMAGGLLWRRTLPFTAAGLVVLYALALRQYGLFHLLDYPIFLGIALYLALTAFEMKPFGLRPLDLLRWAAAVTLMWASIEKWAYPQWTFPLLTLDPDMTMGFSQEVFMRIAGIVEFALAFGLVWTPLVRRFAALILAGMFVSAIFGFGKIDAIGHAPIIAVMLMIAADPVRGVWSARRALLVPAGFAASLAVTAAAYYGLHAALFGTAIV